MHYIYLYLTYLNKDPSAKVQRWKLAVQDYDFDIAYIEGESNIVADPLSRFCPRALSEEEEEEIQNSYTLHWLQSTELHFLSCQEEPKERKQYFVRSSTDISEFNTLVSEIHTTTTRLPHLSERIHGIIALCHNSKVGHHGKEMTLQKVKIHLDNNPDKYKDLVWQNKRQDIDTFIKKCPCCQKMQQLKLEAYTDKYTTSKFGIFENISIDAVYMPTSNNGNKYILTIVDSFTRYIDIYPMKDLTAQAAVTCLIQYMSTYGIPNEICTDNASQFDGIFKEMMTLLDTHNYRIHPYSHQENSIVERANKEIQRHLRNIVFEEKIKNDWDICLPIVKRILNSKIHTSTGVAPVDLVFAGQVDLNQGILFPRNNANDTMTMSEYLKKIYAYQNTLLQVAYANQNETDLLHMAKSSSVEKIIFPTLSYVLVTPENGPVDKLSPRRKGPYQILHRKIRPQGDVYSCLHLATNKVEDFHVTLLTAFSYDEIRTSPIEVATHDHEYHIVDKVLGHRFRNNKFKTQNLQLKIKWEGEQSAEWYDYDSTLKRVEKVHDYLYNNKLATHVSTAFKRPRVQDLSDEDISQKRIRMDNANVSNEPLPNAHYNTRFLHGKTTKFATSSSKR